MRHLCPALLVLSACSTGTRIKTFAPARGPQGVTTTVTRGRATFSAELLAATDTALLVFKPTTVHVVLVPYGAASRVAFSGLPVSYTLRQGRSPSATTLEQLRLWSRFPSGVDAALLRRLLSAYGQETLEVLAPCAPQRC